MRTFSSPANPFAPLHSKFPYNVTAGAVSAGTSAVSVFLKSPLVQAVSVPKAAVYEISTKQIRKGEVPNRCEDAFSNEDFEVLCRSIRLAGGNSTPISVRRAALKPDGTEFVLIYGERRLRACEAVKVDVLAIVVDEDDESSDFLVMVRENLLRKDLSALELGRQALYAVERKLVSSLGSFAREVESSKSRVTEAVRLAQLPRAVLNAFSKPDDLQYRDAKPLTDAVNENLSAVLAEVERVKAESETPSTKAVVSRLVHASGIAVRPSNDENKTVLKYSGVRFGQVQFDKSGKIIIEFDRGLEDKYRPVLEKQLIQFYRKRIYPKFVRSRLTD